MRDLRQNAELGLNSLQWENKDKERAKERNPGVLGKCGEVWRTAVAQKQEFGRVINQTLAPWLARSLSRPFPTWKKKIEWG